MNNLKNKHIISNEITQAMVRIILVGITDITLVGFYLYGRLNMETVLFVSLFLSLSLVWWLLVRTYKGDYPARRLLIAFTDLIAISYAMHIANNELGAIYFFLYLWVIMGNGLRFGPRALIESVVIGFIGFSFVIINTSYWLDNIELSLGMLCGMILLPGYYFILLKRLQTINQQLELELSKANYAATHDVLTGMFNRAYFYQRLNEKVWEAQRYDYHFTVMFIDLDGFKSINDNWGHDYGDNTLTCAAGRLRELSRKSDVAARLGGDEFALILHTMHEKKDIKLYAERVIASIAAPMEIHDKQLFITASIGISQFSNYGETADFLLNRADNAMYASKKNGKNCFTFSEKENIQAIDRNESSENK